MHDLFTLNKYFLYQETIRRLFEKYLIRQDLTADEEENRESFIRLYMDLYYGTLYVVIEGWLELKLYDDKINKLIDSDNSKLLKRYRNGVFHFQKNWYDPRFEEFHEQGENTVNWTIELSKEFGRFFLEKIKEGKLIPPELPEKL